MSEIWKYYAKNRHLSTVTQLCWAISSQLRRVSTIGKKLVKWQYVLHISLQYRELRPTKVWDLLASLGHPSKCQPVSRLGFVTAPTALGRGQPNFARWLAISCTGTLCMHFGGSCPLTEFCQLQNSVFVQLLCSPILAALLHGTLALASAEVSSVVQGMELQNFCRGRHPYSAGRPSRWASAHILVKSSLCRQSVALVLTNQTSSGGSNAKNSRKLTGHKNVP